MKNIIRLPMDGAYNVRDLGGYPIDESKMTNWKVFLRSDDLSAITEKDVELLHGYGIRTIINLKHIGEQERGNSVELINPKVVNPVLKT